VVEARTADSLPGCAVRSVSYPGGSDTLPGRLPPSRLLDPVSLSVRRLKALLDQRGVSYTGVVERQELTELVHQSGMSPSSTVM